VGLSKVKTPRPQRFGSLGSKILLGLALGVASGLFVGEYAAPLKIIGDIFVGLLQMTVLPFIIVSLTASVGRLSVSRGRTLLSRATIVWLGLFAVGACTILAMAQAFPSRSAPSFFSADVITQPKEFDFVALFVPMNVFQSLVENAVPGVVLFCLFIGVALMTTPGRETVITGLDALSEVLSRVNGFVVRLTPWGVFAIAAAAAGTLSVEEFGRLQGYLLVYTLCAGVLALWVLPALVAAFTPFTHREVFHASRDALFTAFATGKVLVVLPMLVESTRRMFEERQMGEGEAQSSIEVLYPLAYPFPYLGKVLALLFIPFAAAFVGRSLELSEYPQLFASGTLGLFGGPILTIPFLLETFELPADMFLLFLVPGVFTARVGDVLGVMNLLAFTVITTCALTGTLQMKLRRLSWVVGVSVALVLVAAGGSRALLESIKNDYRREEVIAGMHIMDKSQMVDARVLERAAPNPVALPDGGGHLERITSSGVLRVGFNDDSLPYAFRNGQGDLVGLDIALAHALARDLGVRLEFVPFERETLSEQIAKDHFDLAMSGLQGTIQRSRQLRLSRPYLDATFAFVVRDYRARDLDTNAEFIGQTELRVGTVTDTQFAQALRDRVPHAEITVVRSTRWFFEAEHDLDALMISAEAGAAWSILYPGFEVVTPTQRRISMPLVYALPLKDEGFAGFIDFWISIQQSMGRIDQLFEYWIRGEGAEQQGPRWSVMRDVLGWVD